MYYDNYLKMITTYLKPSQDYVNFASKFSNPKRLSLHKKNQNLLKPLFAAIFFFLCVIVVPEKPTNLASICEKYNSSSACQVW
tara:strand:- start:200 stop:448 length:249 start_codon:yes stop_codon:yes gene_type:complete